MSGTATIQQLLADFQLGAGDIERIEQAIWEDGDVSLAERGAITRPIHQHGVSYDVAEDRIRLSLLLDHHIQTKNDYATRAHLAARFAEHCDTSLLAKMRLVHLEQTGEVGYAHVSFAKDNLQLDETREWSCSVNDQLVQGFAQCYRITDYQFSENACTKVYQWDPMTHPGPTGVVTALYQPLPPE